MIAIMITAVLTVSAYADTEAVNSSDDGITVYVTLTNDSDFLRGTDGTVIARVPVTLSYFDLKDYGLEQYYRYDDYDEVIEQPTVLHLLIRVLEKYYARRTLTANDMHSNMIDVTGAPKTLWLNRFWNHDGNLMYFVNHQYPLMSEKWGATADYILLEDGDELEMAMYTDWGFYNNSAFLFFEDDVVSAKTGRSVRMHLMANPTSVVNDGVFRGYEVMTNENVRVSSNRGKTWTQLTDKTDEDGYIYLTFDALGTYYVSTGPSHTNYKDAAPAIAVITVTETTEEDERLFAEIDKAISDLQGYKDPEDYRKEEQSRIKAIVLEGVLKLEKAKNEEAVSTVLIEYKIKLDELKTDAQYITEELDAAKSEAKVELEGYKNSSDYREAERLELASIITAGKTAIDNIGNIKDIQTVLTEYKGKIDTLKTDAVYTLEELASAKDLAKTELEMYKDASDYREAEKEVLASYIMSGKAALDGAEDINKVASILAEYKSRIDALKTDSEYTEEEEIAASEEARRKLEQAKTAATTELEQYKSADFYRDAEKALLNALISEGKADINMAESTERVNILLVSYKTEIDALKTDFEYQEEERAAEEEARKKALQELENRKASAKSILSSYKSASDYRQAEKALLAEILADAEAAVDAAKDAAEVETITAEYKERMDALKTDAEYTAEEKAAEEERKRQEEAEEERRRQEEAAEEERKKQEEAAKAEALLAVKKEAVQELFLYVAAADYRDAEREQIFAIQTEAEAKINQALTEDEVRAALADAKALMDQLKTDEQYKAEEEAAKKMVQKITVKVSRLRKYKAAKLRRKKAVFRALTVKGAKGKVTYKVSGNRKSKKALKFNKKTRKITVRKGTKKGLYKLKIRVRAAGNSDYLAGSKTVTIKVRVK